MTSLRDETLDAAAELHDLLNGYWRSQVLCTAARLGLADLMALGPLTLDELAAECGVSRTNLARLMRALVGLDVCTEGEEGYRTTALGRALESGADGGAHDRALLTAELFYPMWADLTDCLCRGGSAVELRAGRSAADLPGGPYGLSALIDTSRPDDGEGDARRVAAACGPLGGSVLVDVGEGAGPLLVALLAAHPQCRGVLHGLPGTTDRARVALAGAGLAARADVVEGDPFTEVPAGDVHLLSSVLHDCDDEHAVALLRAVRRAMHPGGRLLVVEQLLPDHGGADASLHDLHRLVTTGGRERTEGEYAALLAAAGLRHTGTVETGGRRHVVEARPVD